MSKTQAQKNAERLEKIARQEEERLKEKEERDARIKENLQYTNSKPENNNNNLSKKELRKLKKEKRNSLEKPSSPQERFLPVYEPKDDSNSHGSPNDQNIDVKQKIEEDAQKELNLSFDGNATLVDNHSTYCKGLKRVLYSLSKKLPSGCTISPGKISQCSANSETFVLRLQRHSSDTNTYHFVARKGKTAQDVDICVTQSIAQSTLLERIATIVDGDKDELSDEQDYSNLPLSEYNKEKARAKENDWRDGHSKQHAQEKEKEKQIKTQQKEKELQRTLKTKGVQDAAALAKRDLEIKTGKNRTKNSMK